MPTYEYRCPDGHEFERFQRMSDEPKADCPECSKPATRLLSGGGGFLFKGDGFYITDYRSDAYRASAKKEQGGSGSGDGTGSGGGSGEGAGSGASKKGAGEGAAKSSAPARSESGTGAATPAPKPSGTKGTGSSSSSTD